MHWIAEKIVAPFQGADVFWIRRRVTLRSPYAILFVTVGDKRIAPSRSFGDILRLVRLVRLSDGDR